MYGAVEGRTIPAVAEPIAAGAFHPLISRRALVYE